MVSRYSKTNGSGGSGAAGDSWLEQHGPAEIISMLQRGIITLPRAAELMNTSPTSISGLLDQVHNSFKLSIFCCCCFFLNVSIFYVMLSCDFFLFRHQKV